MRTRGLFLCAYFPMSKLPYSKPALAPAALLAHVASRGLTVSDPVAALHALEYIGYYRLLSYMRPLQRTDSVTGLRHFIPRRTTAACGTRRCTWISPSRRRSCVRR